MSFPTFCLPPSRDEIASFGNYSGFPPLSGAGMTYGRQTRGIYKKLANQKFISL